MLSGKLGRGLLGDKDMFAVLDFVFGPRVWRFVSVGSSISKDWMRFFRRLRISTALDKYTVPHPHICFTHYL